MSSPRGALRVPFVLAAPLLLLLGGAAQIHWGEIIPVGSGTGWDGRYYASVATDVPAALRDPALDGYRVRRILPSIVVYLATGALSIPRTPANVRDAFAWLNLALHFCTLLAWMGIARRLRLGEGSRWIGFFLLFLSFANAKMPFYYAVLTDTAAQTLGAALLYFHLSRRRVAMIAVLFLGAFTWPSFLLFGATLLALEPGGESSAPVIRAPTWARAAAVLGGLGFLVLVFAYRTAEPRPIAPVLGAACVLAYLYRCGRDLLDDARLSPPAVLKSLSPLGSAAAVLAAVAVSLIVRAVAAPALFTPTYFLGHLAVYSMARPGVFLVAHAAYFGLLTVVLIAFWRPAVAAAHRLGPGVTAYVLVHLVWGIHSESRQIIDAVPAFVLLAVLALETRQWPRGTVAAVGVLTFLFSKVWLVINRGEFLGRSDPASYPAQLYFLSHGPWMSGRFWLIQGVVLIVASGLLVWVRHRLPPAAEPATALPAPVVSRGVLRVAAAAAGVLCVLALVEWIARASARQVSEPQTPTVAAAPGLGWQRVPSSTQRVHTSEFDTTLAFNEQGLRGPVVAVERPPAVRRVLLLGDAFVEGHAVNEDETTRARLAHALAARGPHEVLNAGVSGYGTVQETLYFECVGRRFQPDTVVIFFRADDLEENGSMASPGECPRPGASGGGLQGRASPGPTLPEDRRPARGSVALRLLANRAAREHPVLHRWMVGIGLASRADPPAPLWGYGPVREVRSWWVRTEESLGTLQRAVGPGGRLVVFYVPEAFEVNDAAWERLLRRYAIGRQRWSRTRVYDTLAETCARLGLPLVDPRAALASDPDSYWPTEGVWTPRGHEIAARELAAALVPGAATR